MWKPMNVSPEVQLAQPLVQHPAGDLREPEVDARRRWRTRWCRTARSGSARPRSRCRTRGSRSAGAASSTPVRPPNRKVTRKPIANSIGVSKVICPRHIVPIQLKNFTPVGHRDQERQEREERQQHGAGGEHVVRPHGHRQRGDRQRGEDQALVAEQRLAAEHREDLGDDAEERQRDDVDLGMAEEPEQVLPEDRRRRWPGRRRARRGAGRPAGRAAPRSGSGTPAAPASR